MAVYCSCCSVVVFYLFVLFFVVLLLGGFVLFCFVFVCVFRFSLVWFGLVAVVVLKGRSLLLFIFHLLLFSIIILSFMSKT